MVTLDVSGVLRHVRHLSPSAVDTWVTCPLRWKFRYVDKIKTPPSGAMHLGTSFHTAVEANHGQKIASREDLPLDVLQDHYGDAFEHPEDDVDWTGERKSAAKDDGAAMVRTYHREVAPSLQPAAVEQAVLIPLQTANGDILPPLLTQLDLIDESRRITDFKTTSKQPDPDAANASGQLTAYEVAHRSAFGAPSAGQELIHLRRPLKSKPFSEVFRQPTSRSDEQVGNYLRHVHAVGLQISVAVQTGLFPMADPNSWACSAKFCGYFAICPGGAVRRTSVATDPLATWKEALVVGGSVPTGVPVDVTIGRLKQVRSSLDEGPSKTGPGGTNEGKETAEGSLGGVP